MVCEIVALMGKDSILSVLKVVAVISMAVFWIMPLQTGTQVLLCLGSFAVFAICSAVSGGLDDQNTGYWPTKRGR